MKSLSRFLLWLFALGLSLLVVGCDASDEPQAEPVAQDRGNNEKIPVWLDVDTAIGLPQAEVDDGLALLQSFHSPELWVRGVSVVYGNTSLDKAVPIARLVVERFGGPEIGVSVGAAGADQLGEETEAVTAMAQALEEGPMTILSIGPVTNTASLVQLYPDLNQQILSIVVVAGRRPGQSFRTGDPSNPPFRDFNFELDPIAMQVLLDSEIPLVLAPWEVSSHVWLRKADLAQLATKSEAGAWVAENTATWVERWQQNLGVDGFNPFDTLAVGWVTHPDTMQNFEGVAWIEESEDDAAPGSGQVKPYLLVEPVVDPGAAEGKTVTYIHTPTDEFKSHLLERLAGPGP